MTFLPPTFDHTYGCVNSNRGNSTQGLQHGGRHISSEKADHKLLNKCIVRSVACICHVQMKLFILTKDRGIQKGTYIHGICVRTRRKESKK